MKIAIVGYGKMGRLIERIATGRGHEIALKVDAEGAAAHDFSGIDVAIDFSIPAAAVPNIEHIASRGVAMVVGTTGWQDQAAHVRQLVEKANVGFVWSPNFSIGVRAFFRIVSAAAKLLSEEPEYEAWAWEIHHSAKKDAPSGTLLRLVDEMRKAGYTAPIDVGSNRAGAMPGTHEIGFDSAADTITLRHTARNREGFALGAVKAAEWIVGRTGFHEL